jgi:hypothetical protein
MMKFARAVSRTPRMSTNVTAATIATAGRLNTPPSSGDEAIESGSAKPNVLSRNSFRLPPQPTATAATETPYSRTRSHPMIHATSSPSVAYAYVYALPDTGIEEASSA